MVINFDEKIGWIKSETAWSFLICYKVECVFPMIIVFILPHLESRPNSTLRQSDWLQKLPFSKVAVDAFHWAHVYVSFRIIKIQWIAEIFGTCAENKSYLTKHRKRTKGTIFLRFFHCTYKTSVKLSGISVPSRSIVEYRTSFSDCLSSKIPSSITFFSDWLYQKSPTPSEIVPWSEMKFIVALNHCLIF